MDQLTCSSRSDSQLVALFLLNSYQLTKHERYSFSIALRLQPSFPDHPKHQLWIEPLPGPRGHSQVVEVICNLTGIQTVILKPKDAVYEGLVGRV